MKNLDINLLPVLQSLLSIRNVTRAAEFLGLSQPATSAALSRLRRYFDDELLVRSGRGYELTPLAQDLQPMVESAMQAIDRVSTIKSQFNPATSDRKFVIVASDYVAAMLVEPLRAILRVEAPAVSVEITPTSAASWDRNTYGKWDLIVGPMGYDLPGHGKPVFRDSFVAVLDAGNPVLGKKDLSAKDLVKLPQAVGFFGSEIRTPGDQFWDILGESPTIAARVQGLLSLPLLVEGTDLMALVPRMLAYKYSRGTNLAIVDFPVEHEAALVEAMFWHTNRHDDPANSWLRSVVQQACKKLHEILETLTPEVRRASIGQPENSVLAEPELE
ncbi:LysR family transcriptional regulator [Glutamicibacter nicotianae]|uniref:LysR family transcriptional regulator n=1 Tax=Glutamicibacter nicotianae TaxID=37929 RepID=UPI002557A4C9|nr:LysR family transcriptional regulator [Glutamicibacter nicotianae]WIV44281.1 LysR family transcriptional regulator [Glutamicibacter nicotianae]